MNPRKKTLIAVLTDLYVVKDVALIAASYLSFEGMKHSMTVSSVWCQRGTICFICSL